MLNGTITASSKDYDGSTSASLDCSGVSIIDETGGPGIINNDNVSVTATGTFDNADAGSNKTVNISNISLTGNKASNYTVSASYVNTTTTASIYSLPASVTDAPTANTLTYTGEPQALLSGGSAEGGTLQYRLVKGTDYDDRPNGLQMQERITFSIRWTAIPIIMTPILSKSLQVTIAKATPEITAPAAKEGLTYTGEDQELITAGTTTFGTLLYSVDGGEYSEAIPTGREAKDYTITYKVEGTDNYNAVEASNPITVTIAKATPTVTAPTAVEGLTYTGQEQALVTEGSTTGGILQYSLDGGEYDEAIPTGIDAKDYTITYKVVGTDNYNGVEAGDPITVTIAKATPTVTPPTAIEGLEYTGAPQALITAGDATGGEMQYSTDGESFSAEIPTGEDAGTYYIYYKVEEGGNYNAVEAGDPITVTIAKANATVTAPTGNTLNYTGQAQTLVTGGEATGGTLEYSTDGKTYSTTVPTGTDVGEYTVYYRVTGDANHNDVAAASVHLRSTVETA